MAEKHHKVDFFELRVSDMNAAKAFYTKAFGWTYQDYGPEYADIQGAGLSGGLAFATTAASRGGALIILYSDDLAASEQTIIDAGGLITSRHEFPGGRRFQFSDPAGNELAVWTKA
jgi:uncharacterized protein